MVRALRNKVLTKQKQKEQEEQERQRKEAERVKRMEDEVRLLAMEKKRKENEMIEKKRREDEMMEKKRKEDEMIEKKRKEDEMVEKKRREDEAIEKKRKEDEMIEKKRKEDEAMEKKRKEDEMVEKKRKEEEALAAGALAKHEKIQEAVAKSRSPLTSQRLLSSSDEGREEYFAELVREAQAARPRPAAGYSDVGLAAAAGLIAEVRDVGLEEGRAGRGTGEVGRGSGDEDWDPTLVNAFYGWGLIYGGPGGAQDGDGEEVGVTAAEMGMTVSGRYQDDEGALRGDSLSKVSLNVEDLKDTAGLSAYRAVTVLELNVNRLKRLDHMSHLTTLTALSAKDNVITDISGISLLVSLRTLCLDNNALTNVNALSGLSNLSILTLNTNKLSSLPPLTKLSRLQRLDVYHNQISHVTLEDLLGAAPSLTHLDLGRNRLEHVDGVALSTCQLLSHLVLSQNKLKAAPYPLYLPFLRTLWLSGNRISGLGEWSRRYKHRVVDRALLEGLPTDCSSPLFLPMLEKLYLQDNVLVTIPSRTFLCAPVLTDIDLSFNRLAAPSDILGLLHCPKLKRLQLQDNVVGADVRVATWLCRSCPLLIEISGKVVTPSTSRDVRTAVITLTQGQNLVAQLTDMRRRYSRQRIGDEELREMANLPINDTEEEVNLDRETYPPAADNMRLSPRALQLLHVLSTMGTEQNVARSRRRDDFSSVPIDAEGALPAEPLLAVLRRHRRYLMSWAISDEQHRRHEFHSFVAHFGSQRRVDENNKSRGAPPPNSNDTKNCDSVSVSKPSFVTSGLINPLHVSPDVRKAVTNIQSRYRGIRVRRQLHSALQSAKYIDEELDDMLNGGEDDDLMEFLGAGSGGTVEDLPVFKSMRMRESIPVRTGGNVAWNSSGNDSDGNRMNNAMVYGDHKRRKSPSVGAPLGRGTIPITIRAGHPWSQGHVSVLE